jgi:hypothetical protein
MAKRTGQQAVRGTLAAMPGEPCKIGGRQMINDRVLKSSDIMLLGDILVTENGSQIPVIGYSGQVVSDAVNDHTNFIECRRPQKVEESPGTVPGVPAANTASDAIALCQEIVTMIQISKNVQIGFGCALYEKLIAVLAQRHT